MLPLDKLLDKEMELQINNLKMIRLKTTRKGNCGFLHKRAKLLLLYFV